MRSWMLVALAFTSFAVTSLAQSPARTYAGGFSTAWKTVGHHGHDQPCRIKKQVDWLVGSPREDDPMFLVDDCDGSDFANSNLDNSIGFRAGRERDYASWRMFRFVGGVDASLTDTEYNISQRDLVILTGAGVAGLDVERWGARLGVRYGLGLFGTTDFHYGVHSFKEVGLTLPVSGASAIRVVHRTAVHSLTFDNSLQLAGIASHAQAAEVKEYAVMLITRPDADPSASYWAFAAGTGVSSPGKVYGPGLSLSAASYHRLAARRDLGRTPLQVQVSWTSSAHESLIEGAFNGYPRNLRSKTIDSFGLALRANSKVWRGISAYGTLGAEVADWEDDHGLLVRTRGAERAVVAAKIEGGAAAGAGLRWMFGRAMGIEAMVEQVYWRRIDLGERRTGFMFVVSR